MLDNTHINHLLPFIAAQIYAFCLFYLIVVRRKYLKTFPYLSLFLGAMICFLTCYLVDQFEHTIHDAKLIHLRLLILIGVGFPSLSIATSHFSDQEISKHKMVLLYCTALLLALMAIFFNSIAWRESFGDQTLYFSNVLPGFSHASFCSNLCIVLATVGVVFIPCIFQLRHVRTKNITHLAFLISALLFALLFMLGILLREWWIYYTGAIVCAVIFLAAVYIDIHYLNQTSAFIKEELRFHVTQGQRSSQALSELVEKLENSTGQNIDVYKLRVREVISLLVNEAIESGGAVEDLIQRNKETSHKIDTATDIETLTKVTEMQAKELSNIITSLPLERKRQMVGEVKSYIADHLGEDLSIQVLTDKFSVSRSYLTSAFKEVGNCTVNAYIVSSRIELAKTLLLEKSITETAFEIGFNNSNYFSTVFKKQMGITPKEYQQNRPNL